MALNPNLDLTQSRMVVRGERGLVFQRIAYGYGAMPGFAHKLEQRELDALTGYTLGFRGRR